MKAIRLEGAKAQGRDVDGRVLVHDLGPDLRKGTILGGRHLEQVRQAREVHLVELEPGDLHEDEAAKRLAAALAGPGLEAQRPVQSQARLIARHRGLVRVRADAVDAINSLGYISVFTLMDGQAVAEGEEVAGCKVTPVAVPGTPLSVAVPLPLSWNVRPAGRAPVSCRLVVGGRPGAVWILKVPVLPVVNVAFDDDVKCGGAITLIVNT